MPLYEYQCSKCGKIFEVIQKFSDAPLTVHEGCGGAVERLISAPAFHLKGTGWYATDYAKGGTSLPDRKGESKSEGDTSDAKAAEKSSPADSSKGSSKDSGGKDASGKDASKDTKKESKPAPASKAD